MQIVPCSPLTRSRTRISYSLGNTSRYLPMLCDDVFEPARAVFKWNCGLCSLLPAPNLKQNSISSISGFRRIASSGGSSGQLRGGEQHEIYAAAFGGHLFMTYFHRAGGGMASSQVRIQGGGLVAWAPYSQILRPQLSF